MGSWWNRKGENEIDLVCEDEIKGVLDFYEVKSDASRYDAKELAAKIGVFLTKHPEKQFLKRTQSCLSLEDM